MHRKGVIYYLMHPRVCVQVSLSCQSEATVSPPK
jgi:hypothetical protein